MQNETYMEKSRLIQRSIMNSSNGTVQAGLDRGGGVDIPIVLVPWGACCFHCCMEVRPPAVRLVTIMLRVTLNPSLISASHHHTVLCGHLSYARQVPTGSHVLWERFDQSSKLRL